MRRRSSNGWALGGLGVVSVAMLAVYLPSCKAAEQLQEHLSGVQFEMRASKVDVAKGTFVALAPPPTKREPAMLVHDGAIFALGGVDGSLRAVGAVEKLDPKTNAWTTLAPWPSPRIVPRFWELGGQLCALGGLLSSSSNSRLLTCYDPAKNTWGDRAALPEAAGGGDFRATVANGAMYVFANSEKPTGTTSPFSPVTFADAGDETGGAATGDLNPTDFYAYDPATDAWTQKKSAPFACSDLAANYVPGAGKERMVAIGTNLYVIGCRQKLASGALVDATLVYDTKNDTWKEIPPAGIVNPGLAFAVDGKVVLVGRDAPFVATLDPASDVWSTPKALVPPMVPWFLSATPDGTGGVLVLVLEEGDGKTRTYSGDLWRYDLAGDTWKKIGTQPRDVDVKYRPVLQVMMAGGDPYVVGGWESAALSIY